MQSTAWVAPLRAASLMKQPSARQLLWPLDITRCGACTAIWRYGTHRRGITARANRHYGSTPNDAHHITRCCRWRGVHAAHLSKCVGAVPMRPSCDVWSSVGGACMCVHTTSVTARLLNRSPWTSECCGSCQDVCMRRVLRPVTRGHLWTGRASNKQHLDRSIGCYV